MKANIINYLLSKGEYIDFVFDVEDNIEQIKQRIIEKYKTTLIEKLELNDWIVIDNLYFGKSKEYLLFYKLEWKHQFVLFFDSDYSNLCIGVNPQFQTDIDPQLVGQIQKALASLKTIEVDSKHFWIWLDEISFTELLWSEIYAGKLFQSTICVIAQMMMMLEDVKL